jgi:hypothetical protein
MATVVAIAGCYPAEMSNVRTVERLKMEHLNPAASSEIQISDLGLKFWVANLTPGRRSMHLLLVCSDDLYRPGLL